MGGFTLLTQVTAQPIALFKKNLGKVKRTSVILIFLLIGANVSDEIWESVRSGGCCDEYWRDPCRARGPGSTTLLFLAFLFLWSKLINILKQLLRSGLKSSTTLRDGFVFEEWSIQFRGSSSKIQNHCPGFSVGSVAFNQPGSTRCEMESTLFNFLHLSWSPRVRWACDKEDV